MSSRLNRRGPSRTRLVFCLPGLLRNPLAQFISWKERYGDVVAIPLRNPPTLHLSNPEDIRHVLAVNPLSYRKTGALTIGRRLLGDGLLASEEPLHQQQRKSVQPHFTRQHVSSFASIMRDTSLRRMEGWKDGTVVDVFSEMAHLTIVIIGKSCFSTDLSEHAMSLFRDFGICQRFMQKLVNLPDTFPTPLSRQYRKAVQRIDSLIDGIIATRMSLREKPPDLLTTLLESKDANGRPIAARQVRDEMINILLAGHETTAIALAWTWYLLSLHPEAERRFHDELSDILCGSDADGVTHEKLRFTELVLNESMRLRPPVWILGRVAMEDDTLPAAGFVPRGTEVLMLPYIAHRNPQYFPDPGNFSPDRFSEEGQPNRPPFVYFPFGGGPRGCVGESFARMEAKILLATIGKRFALRAVPDHPVVPEPLVTLRPKHGIRMRIHDREGAHHPNASRSLRPPEASHVVRV